LLDDEPPRALAFDPSGAMLASAAPDGARVWDLRAARQVRHFDRGREVRAVAFHPVRPVVAVARRGGVTAWDVTTGDAALELQSERKQADFETVQFADAGSRLLTSHRGHVQVWDGNSGTLLEKLAMPRGDSAAPSVVEHRGQLLIATDRVRRWSTDAPPPLATPPGEPWVELHPGMSAAGLSLTAPGKAALDGEPLDVPLYGGLADGAASRASQVLPASAVRVSPLSPTGRYQILIADPDDGRSLRAPYLLDRGQRRLTRIDTGRFGPQQWVQWSGQERYALLVHADRDDESLWAVDLSSGATAEVLVSRFRSESLRVRRDSVAWQRASVFDVVVNVVARPPPERGVARRLRSERVRIDLRHAPFAAPPEPLAAHARMQPPEGPRDHEATGKPQRDDGALERWLDFAMRAAEQIQSGAVERALESLNRLLERARELMRQALALLAFLGLLALGCIALVVAIALLRLALRFAPGVAGGVAGAAALAGVAMLVWTWVTLPPAARMDDVINTFRIFVRREATGLEMIDSVRNLRVPLDHMSPHLITALIAKEDRRFHSHFGFDPVRMVGAVVGVGGASTISQQLARSLFLSRERSYLRKFKEMLLAVKLERRYGKHRILEMYLNNAYFGRGAYGVETASRIYFQKTSAELTLLEAAALIATLPKPAVYNPARSPNRAEVVLATMVANGSLTEAEAQKTRKTSFERGTRTLHEIQPRYFFDWLRPLLEPHLPDEGDALWALTTLDPELQVYAENSLWQGLDRLTKRGFAASEGALVAIDPEDGAVRAMVGGRDYGLSQYNRAVQARRSIGSLAKPFVALAALEKGWREDSPIQDAPLEVGDYRPRNFDGRFHGTMTLSRALATSCNTCAVRLQEAVGRKPVAALTSRIVPDLEVRPDLTFALGTTDASPLQMAAGYAAFANGGYGLAPYGIVTLRSPEGATLEWRRRPELDRVATPTAISALNRLLRGVIGEGGTAAGARIDGQDAAGKTGTTQDHADAWFVGYTRHLVTAVWTGNDDPARKTNGLTGGVAAAEIWAPMMRSAHSHLEYAREPLP